MPAIGLNHYNLRAPRELLEALRVFYCDVVGLKVGARPPFTNFGYWLYAGESPILHLTESKTDKVPHADDANSFDHAAFTCTGRQTFELLLNQRGIKFSVAHVPQSENVQIFFKDPAGNGVELNFENAEA